MTTDYGMSYSDPADIELSLLDRSQTTEEMEVEGRWGTSIETLQSPRRSRQAFRLRSALSQRITAETDM